MYINSKNFICRKKMKLNTKQLPDTAEIYILIELYRVEKC
jgi:hypothetical protein